MVTLPKAEIRLIPNTWCSGAEAGGYAAKLVSRQRVSDMVIAGLLISFKFNNIKDGFKFKNSSNGLYFDFIYFNNMKD